jgi:hypothetical protein
MPKDTIYKQIFIDRIKVLGKAKKDKGFREIFKERCKRDVIFFAIVFVRPMTLEKNHQCSLLYSSLNKKSICYGAGKASKKEHGLVEKSRDMGLSYLNVLSQTHAWLFEQGYAGLMTSRKEMLVDRRGDPSSIFEKIRIILRYLPSWMLPEGFSWSEHDNYMRLVNPENGSVLLGSRVAQVVVADVLLSVTGMR